jgi:hypothetical protein
MIYALSSCQLMQRENLGGRGPTVRPTRSPRPVVGDRRGVGGFYEAIMALMIVTAGVVLLTCSFTFLAVGEEEKDDLHLACEEIASSVLGNRTISPGERMVDQSQLDGPSEWRSSSPFPTVHRERCTGTKVTRAVRGALSANR